MTAVHRKGRKGNGVIRDGLSAERDFNRLAVWSAGWCETNPQDGSVGSLLDEKEENIVEKITLQIGNSSFMATLENNAAVDAFVEMMSSAPIIIQMSDYSGFEKVGSLGTSLPVDDSQTTTHAGDIVLYNGNQIVIFYGSNSWNYTRLGKIDDLSGWEDALGSGDVMVTFSLE